MLAKHSRSSRPPRFGCLPAVAASPAEPPATARDRVGRHDLRHTFGTRMIRQADIRRVQEWMGHADVQTTMKYLHYDSRGEDAELVARAFRTE